MVRYAAPVTTPGTNTDQLAILVGDLTPEILAIHERVHALLHEVVPQAEEYVDLPDRVLAFGSSLAMRDLWFALIAHKSWVNVQLADGALLEDPDGIVEGTGKRIRHVKVRSAEDADRPALRAMIERQVRFRE